MNKQFCSKKFQSLLFTASLSMIVEYLMLLSDTVIIGNIFGEEAIAAVNLVMLVFSIAVFVGAMICTGTSVFYSFEMGSCHKEKADELFGQGVMFSLIAGIFLSLLAILGKNLYFQFMNPSEIVVTILLFLFGRYLARVFGITDPVLLDNCQRAIRLVCPFLVCSSVLFLLTTNYLLIERGVLATLITGLKDGLALISMMLLFGSFFGIDGVWAGFGIAPVISLLLTSLVLIVRYGRERFPLLLEDEKEDFESFDLYLTEENIIELRDKVEDVLRKKGISAKIISRIMLLIEEMGMLIREKNGGKKILAECTVITGKEIRVIFRDDGVLFDLTDADNKISSIRSYVVSSLMDHQPTKLHLITMSYNRNIFRFPRETE